MRRYPSLARACACALALLAAYSGCCGGFRMSAAAAGVETRVVGEGPKDAGVGPDRAALMDLYASTRGGQWRDSAGWGSNASVCGWYGLSCNSARRVEAM